MQAGDLALLNYGEVPLTWHTRLILAHTTHSCFIILTPDLDRYEEQLDAGNPDLIDFEFLGPSGNIPPRIPPASVYGFRGLAAADLAHHMGQARAEALVIQQQRGVGAAGAAPVAPPPVPPVPPAPRATCWCPGSARGSSCSCSSRGWGSSDSCLGRNRSSWWTGKGRSGDVWNLLHCLLVQ